MAKGAARTSVILGACLVLSACGPEKGSSEDRCLRWESVKVRQWDYYYNHMVTYWIDECKQWADPSAPLATAQHRESASFFVEAKELAERGFPESQFALGSLYLEGSGVARNEAEAERWFRQAAEQGNYAGISALMEMYEARGDHAGALAEWQHLAALGYEPAAYQIAVAYAEGKGVPQNDAEAAKWFRQSAELENSDAQTELGKIYAEGRGVARDDAEAAKWFRRAAEQWRSEAAYELGKMYADGRGVGRDDVQAYRWTHVSASMSRAAFRDGNAKEEVPAHVIELRESLAQRMTSEQTGEGQRQAEEWLAVNTWEKVSRAWDLRYSEMKQRLRHRAPAVEE